MLLFAEQYLSVLALLLFISFSGCSISLVPSWSTLLLNYWLTSKKSILIMVKIRLSCLLSASCLLQPIIMVANSCFVNMAKPISLHSSWSCSWLRRLTLSLLSIPFRPSSLSRKTFSSSSRLISLLSWVCVRYFSSSKAF